MELKQLEYFLTISKLKSFTMAADQLYISQPGITSAIRRLEDELGVELFAKKRKTAVLTPEGKIFANHIENVINDVNNALHKVEELKNLSKGTIHVGISPVSSISTASFLIAKFNALYPDLELIFAEDSSENLQRRLEEDELDIAFLVLDVPNETLDAFALTTQELVVGLPSFHMFKGKTSLTPEILQKEKLVLLKHGCPIRQRLDTYFSEASCQLTASLETNYIQTILRLVLCGAGITILPAEAFEGNTNFTTVPLEQPLAVTTYAACRKAHTMSKATQTLLDFIKTSCAL